MVLSYPLDNNLYVSDDFFDTYRTYNLVSDSYAPPKLLSDHSNRLSEREFRRQGGGLMNRSTQYLNLIYDPSLDVYYRIVRVPHEEKVLRNYESGVVKRLPAPDYSVMVIDKDFQVILEKRFPLKDYRFDLGVFAAKDGLWVLKPENNNEDQMMFEKLIFKLK